MQGGSFSSSRKATRRLRFADEAEGLELFDDAGEGVVVERLAADEFEGDAEAGVDAVEFDQERSMNVCQRARFSGSPAWSLTSSARAWSFQAGSSSHFWWERT
jgi:hypothetical protein